MRYQFICRPGPEENTSNAAGLTRSKKRRLPPASLEESSTETYKELDTPYCLLPDDGREVEERRSAAGNIIGDLVNRTNDNPDITEFVQDQIIGHVDRITQKLGNEQKLLEEDAA